MVYTDGGKLSKSDKWWYRVEQVEVVIEHTYLGVTSTLTFHGSYILISTTLYLQLRIVNI